MLGTPFKTTLSKTHKIMLSCAMALGVTFSPTPAFANDFNPTPVSDQSNSASFSLIDISQNFNSIKNQRLTYDEFKDTVSILSLYQHQTLPLAKQKITQAFETQLLAIDQIQKQSLDQPPAADTIVSPELKKLKSTFLKNPNDLVDSTNIYIPDTSELINSKDLIKIKHNALSNDKKEQFLKQIPENVWQQLYQNYNNHIDFYEANSKTIQLWTQYSTISNSLDNQRTTHQSISNDLQDKFNALQEYINTSNDPDKLYQTQQYQRQLQFQASNFTSYANSSLFNNTNFVNSTLNEFYPDSQQQKQTLKPFFKQLQKQEDFNYYFGTHLNKNPLSAAFHGNKITPNFDIQSLESATVEYYNNIKQTLNQQFNIKKQPSTEHAVRQHLKFADLQLQLIEQHRNNHGVFNQDFVKKLQQNELLFIQAQLNVQQKHYISLNHIALETLKTSKSQIDTLRPQGLDQPIQILDSHITNDYFLPYHSSTLLASVRLGELLTAPPPQLSKTKLLDPDTTAHNTSIPVVDTFPSIDALRDKIQQTHQDNIQQAAVKNKKGLSF